MRRAALVLSLAVLAKRRLRPPRRNRDLRLYAHQVSRPSPAIRSERLGGPRSGSPVTCASGGYGVSDEQLDQVHRARVGDQVMLCLARIPQHYPPGDSRGRIYTATDVRALESWTLPDCKHSCGGV